jgi:FAD binding domain
MSSIQVATLSGSPAMISQSDVESFRAALRGRLLLPGDESYDDARTVYNAAIDRHPGAIVRCRGTADVIDAVKLAERHELLMAVRGGGHNVAGLGVCDDGLVIDLTEMRGVHLNLGARTVRAQGGTTWGDLDRETQAFGLIAPGGVVSTTGIGGLTLNGGLGHVRNKFGLSCDNLVSADVVTANGELLTASATDNPICSGRCGEGAATSAWLSHSSSGLTHSAQSLRLSWPCIPFGRLPESTGSGATGLPSLLMKSHRW